MRATRMFRLLILLVCLPALSVPLFGQGGRGTITGTVTDTSGAVIPGAEVIALNQETGVENKTVTTDVGVYRIPYLSPGKYKISVALSGFKTAVRENVEILLAQTVGADFKLEVGEVSETVTVSMETPLLESSTSEIGSNMTQLEVHAWPMFIDDGTRQIQSFIFNSLPGTNGGSWEGSINGSQSFTHETLVEGITIGRMDLNGGNTSEYSPTVDAISEFKLQTGAVSAQYGNTQTGLANYGLKSGTNAYHGTAFYMGQNDALNAKSWGSTKKQPFRLHNFGATLGGPIIKDKTFFFFSYEGERHKDFRVRANSWDALPVPEFNTGDFHRLFDPNFTRNAKSGTIVGKDALGRDVKFGQIYDPMSTQQLEDGTWVRNPFPNNIIPASRFSAVTKAILAQGVPSPDFPLKGARGETLRENATRISNCCPIYHINNYTTKIDHVFSESHKMASSYTFNDRYRYRFGGSAQRMPGDMPNPSPLFGDRTQSTIGTMIRASEDWTVSPTKINHLGIGYNRMRNANQSNSFLSGTNWAKVTGIKGTSGNLTFPVSSFGGANSTLSGGYRNFGDSGTSNEPNGSVVLVDDFSWIKGAHSLKFGVEHRRYYLNGQSTNGTGSYAFNSDQTALSKFTASTGFSYASFLLGTAASANNGIVKVTPGYRSRTTDFYFQDDWKVSPTVTLNLGLRWDIPTGITEVANRMSAMDPNMPNPGADGFKGALEFLGDCQGCSGRTRFWDYYWKEFAPRVGIAWAVSPKLVLRGGYGINYAPPLLDGWNNSWGTGFDGSNPYRAKTGRPGGGQDPAFQWDSVYKPYTATLPNTDPTQLNYDYIAIYPADSTRAAMVQNWNFGIQYELPWQTRLEANYVGNHGSRLNSQYLGSLNQLNPSYLSLGDALLESVDLHPEIKKPFPSFDGEQTVSQALRPWPQYLGVSAHRLAGGWSNYNSLQLTFTKRSEVGLSFLAAYTFSKGLGTTNDAIGYYTSGQDIFNLKGDYGVTSLHVPQSFKLTWIYDLPFGKGHRLSGPAVVNAILGGWTMSANQSYQSGSPVAIGGSVANTDALGNRGFYVDVLLPKDQQIIGSKPTVVDFDNGTQYLNPKAFADVPMTDNQVPLRMPNGPRYLSNVRYWSSFNENFALVKRTPLGISEDSTFELRAEFANFLNRVSWDGFGTDISDQESFGKVYGRVGANRTVQLGARVNF